MNTNYYKIYKESIQECTNKYEQQIDYNQLMRKFLWNFCEKLYYIYLDKENRETYMAIDNKRFRKVQGYIYDNESKDDGLLDLTRIEDKLNKLHEEKQNLKKALWEAEKSYIEETNTNSIHIEQDIEYLKEEFKREYWNNDVDLEYQENDWE